MTWLTMRVHTAVGYQRLTLLVRYDIRLFVCDTELNTLPSHSLYHVITQSIPSYHTVYTMLSVTHSQQ